MIRHKNRRSLRLETLESRELLSQGGPSAQQEYMLYLLNQARANPAQMAERVTTNLSADVQATVQYYNVNLDQVRNAIASAKAQPPLAWNNQLTQAAQGHSQDMANNNFQSHTGSDGSSSNQRMSQAGYSSQSTSGEDAFAYATSVDEAMEAYLIDWGVSSNGHRDNILQPGTSADDTYRDVGIGLVSGGKGSVGPLVVTNDFASQPNEQAQLVGVVFNDPGHTQFMNYGAGQGGVTITATNAKTGDTTSVQTWDSGGYQIPLDPGQYQVTATYNNQVVGSATVTIKNVNVALNFDLSDPLPGTAPDNSTPAPAVVTASSNANTNNNNNNNNNQAPANTNNNSNNGGNTDPAPMTGKGASVQVAIPIAPSAPPIPSTGWSTSWSRWKANVG